MTAARSHSTRSTWWWSESIIFPNINKTVSSANLSIWDFHNQFDWWIWPTCSVALAYNEITRDMSLTGLFQFCNLLFLFALLYQFLVNKVSHVTQLAEYRMTECKQQQVTTLAPKGIITPWIAFIHNERYVEVQRTRRTRYLSCLNSEQLSICRLQMRWTYGHNKTRTQSVYTRWSTRTEDYQVNYAALGDVVERGAPASGQGIMNGGQADIECWPRGADEHMNFIEVCTLRVGDWKRIVPCGLRET